MLTPMVTRLLAAGSPALIKNLRAGVLLAGTPGFLALPEGSTLSSLFSAPGSGMLALGGRPPRVAPPPIPKQKQLSEEERELQQRADVTRHRAMEIMSADDWRLIDSQDGDELFIKTWQGRSIWKFRTVIDCEAEKMAAELIYNCENCPSWNTAVKRCRAHPVAGEVEILHQETGSLFGGLVSRREFVNLRQRGRRGQMHFSAVTAIDHADFPHRNNYVRGENFPTVFTVRPCGETAGRCVVEGTLNYDLKLRLVPMQLIERGMHPVWRQLRSQMLQLAERVRAAR